MLITKDVTHFYRWFTDFFENLFYRKHRRPLYALKLFFCNYLFIYFRSLKCLGFFIKIRGKIGVGGNSKRRRYVIRSGVNGFSKKSIRFVFYKGLVRTPVGVLGFKLALHFN